MTGSKTHWESIYAEKTPLEVSWHQSSPTLSLQLIHSTQVVLSDPVIDVGGGSSTLVDYLLDKGFSHVAVLDISDKALEYTRNRLGDKADRVEWYSEDITRFNPPHQFSLWHDRAVFHFLTNETDRKKYLDVLKNSLLPNGHLIIAAFAIGGPTKCSNLDIVQYDAKKLMAELGPDFELLEEKNEIHLTPANKEQMFNYFHFRIKP